MWVANLSGGGSVVIQGERREMRCLYVGAALVSTRKEVEPTLLSDDASTRRAQAIAAVHNRPGVDEVDDFGIKKRVEAVCK
jgi:hypothetical protein